MAGIPHSMPPMPPPIPPAGGKKGPGGGEEVVRPAASRPEGVPSSGRGPDQMDSAAMAVALAAASAKAKEKELSFEEIIQRLIDETGMTNPQEAMEEANRKTQKEIEAELVKIRENKDLMEESEAWEEFAKILEQEMTQEQYQAFFGLLTEEIKGL